MRKIALTAVCFALAGFLPVFHAEIVAAAHEADRFLGLWNLDTKVSKYPGDSCPKQMTIEMTQEPGGIHYHSLTTPKQGADSEADYTAKYDGRPAFVTGTRGVLLPVTLQKESETAVKASYSDGFTTVATSTRTLSADGNTMTITTITHDRGGLSIETVGVYRRAVKTAELRK